MRRTHFAFAIVALLGLSSSLEAAFSFTGPVTNIDGRATSHVQFPTQEAAVNYRPGSASQKSLLLQNLYIHDLTNQKGLDIRATRLTNAPAWAYDTITLRNLRISNVERREDLPGGSGLHIDHIRIAGGGNSQNVKTNILIENVEINGGDALPILITDGIYGTVTIRNVSIKNTTLNNIQFKTDKVGSVDRIIIENSPDIGVALIGRPGSIGEVLVRNSANIRLGDSPNAAGRSGATISYIDAANGSSSPGLGSSLSGDVNNLPPVFIPEPGTMTLIAGAMLIVARRPRR